MYKNLKEYLPGFAAKKVIVWGDLILDEYIYTTTSRISREAPVLVTEFESNEYILGGAGNVVMNIKKLGAVPIPVAFVGTNADGKTLKKILTQNHITTDFLVEVEDYRTPKKSRILSGGENTKKQQVLRIDALARTEIPKTAYQNIEDTLRTLLAETDYLIISDYLYKSVIPEVYSQIHDQYPGRQMIIDSRDHLMEFKNVSIATPNEPEIKKLFPVKNFFTEQEFYEAGEELRKRLHAAGIILKRGHKGMIVFEKDKAPEKVHIHGPAEIVDVTGAGDTVISVISLALSAGADFLSAARLANVAAGIVVMKEGCYPISIHELENELR